MKLLVVNELASPVFLNHLDPIVVLLTVQLRVLNLLPFPLTVLKVGLVKVLLILAEVELSLFIVFKTVLEFLHEHPLHHALVVLCRGVACINPLHNFLAWLTTWQTKYMLL